MEETKKTETEETEKPKKELTPQQKFWIRFVCWTLFSVILPVSFIIWRYELFTKISSVQFGGWGFIAIIIVCVFAFTLIKYVKAGMVKWSMTKQVIGGVAKVIIPLGCLFFVLYSVKDNLDLFLQALGNTILCEAVAIPINPMPQWVYEKSKGQTEDTIDYFFKRYDETQKKGETK